MNKILLNGLVAATMAYGVNANASDAVSINDTNLGAISVSSFDWTPGSALAVGAVPVAAAPGSTTFNLYTQASLGNFIGANSLPILGTGLNSSYELTFQAGFTEVGSTTAGGAVANFGLAPTQTVNFFNIYYDTNMNANALAGTGYGDGDLVLSAIVTGNSTVFAVINPAPTALDQFGTNDYPGYYSITGTGGGSLSADVTGLNQARNFFNNATLASLIVELAFNTSNVLPFQQVDPSGSVVDKAIALSLFTATDCDAAGIGASGQLAGGGCYINGLANPGTTDQSDFLFQADANQSFTVRTTVPEPGSLVLLGGGLLAAGASRKQRKAI
ncbi:PEP-CTERM sorting domain-containing protein [Methylomonas koyamae]|uniref:PEP-CTERM sorting domain-containing protein n=1 Tax=Methylomonas koyamae TaxID=702114 RepID=UPI001C33E866|nr:PEP-CTERM sorting domain-containing protein [Methylomonas koyamae]BBL57808.1 hypothetical protein MKFW12EY_14210 [Methylomonas koyamae]